MRPNVPADFWAKVDKSGDCWLWTAGTDRRGYGKFRINYRHYRTHRFAWEDTHGTIDADLCVCHRCDNPPCVNPAHLFLGTHTENHEDMVAKGRHPKGTTHGMAKLNQKEADEIRDRYRAGGISQAQLAREHGVTQALISLVILRKTWSTK